MGSYFYGCKFRNRTSAVRHTKVYFGLRQGKIHTFVHDSLSLCWDFSVMCWCRPLPYRHGKQGGVTAWGKIFPDVQQ